MLTSCDLQHKSIALFIGNCNGDCSMSGFYWLYIKIVSGKWMKNIKHLKFGLIFAVKKERSAMIHMKKNLLIFLLTVSSLAVQAQFAKNPMKEVVSSFKLNHLQDISRYMDDYISVTLNNNQSLYSKNQAEIIIKDFFDKNAASEFSVINDGSEEKNTKFALLSFESNREKYSLYILLKEKDNSYIIQEIRINPE